MTSPVRGPIMRRIDRRSANLIAQALSSHDRPRPPSQGLDSIEASLSSLNHRIEESITPINHSINTLVRDVELSLNSVVRDLFRLQAKIDILQQSIDQQLSETKVHCSGSKRLSGKPVRP
jgi:hypothetical protein